MQLKIKEAINRIEELAKKQPIKVISHFDADGITSAAIFSRAMQRWKKQFSLEVVKGLEEEFIKNLPEDNILIFLDLASGSLDYLAKKNCPVFILDHHEIMQKIPENVFMVNPLLLAHEPVSGAAIAYLFARELSPQNKDLATLALIGMVGDSMEKNLNKVYDEIIKDSEATVKKGLLIYPSTRPLDKSLEYSSSPFIPGVTGSYKGAIELLKDAGIQRDGERYKSINELNEEEMSKLITAIMLRGITERETQELIGNIYLIKFFNKLEDVRELSALINACSRMDHPYVALGFCLGNKSFKEQAEKIYIEYKQNLVSALKYVNEMEKIKGKDYTIINAKNNVKDTIIGTVASILSHSSTYEHGTIIIALAYNEDKIKVSARIKGRNGRNVRDVLHRAVVQIGGEVGGHPEAAGCLISKDKEVLFLEELKKVLEIDESQAIVVSKTP
jgi:single-stranded-DNA-specific exonuclease